MKFMITGRKKAAGPAKPIPVAAGFLAGALIGYTVVAPLAMVISHTFTYVAGRGTFAGVLKDMVPALARAYQPEFLGWTATVVLLCGIIGLIIYWNEFRYRNVSSMLEKEMASAEEKEGQAKRELARMMDLASSLPCGLTIISPEYRIEFLNENLRRIFGNAVGKTCYVEFRSRKKPCPDCPTQRALKSMATESAELRRRDGTEIELVSTPLKNPDGSYSAIELIHDITERKRIAEKLERLAITDGLTGLHNRRQLNITLPFEIARSQRQKHPLSLLFFDIDSFKAFNDLYGHQRGDEVLQKTGSIVKDNIRGYVDSAYRYGGEEFVVILPEVNSDKAREIGERIRSSFKQANFDMISLSLGVVEYQSGWDANTFMRHADSAMYKAKGLGRDRVHVYGT